MIGSVLAGRLFGIRSESSRTFLRGLLVSADHDFSKLPAEQQRRILAMAQLLSILEQLSSTHLEQLCLALSDEIALQREACSTANWLRLAK